MKWTPTLPKRGFRFIIELQNKNYWIVNITTVGDYNEKYNLCVFHGKTGEVIGGIWIAVDVKLVIKYIENIKSKVEGEVIMKQDA